jgi:[protein-PII] uridylyltransferase
MNMDATLARVISTYKRCIVLLRQGRGGGIEVATSLTGVMDGYLIENLANRCAEDGWALFAVGGYGRGQLSFMSDVDCLLCYKGEEPTDVVEALSLAVRALWDIEVKAKIACHPIEGVIELAQKDEKFFASILDARFILGSKEIRRRFEKEVDILLPPEKKRWLSFVEFLLNEQKAKDTDRYLQPFSAEPDLKRGSGGLRDMATIKWLADFAKKQGGFRGLDVLANWGEEQAFRVRGALETVLLARHILGGVLKQKTERLTRDATLATERMQITPNAQTFARKVTMAMALTFSIKSTLVHFVHEALDMGALTCLPFSDDRAILGALAEACKMGTTPPPLPQVSETSLKVMQTQTRDLNHLLMCALDCPENMMPSLLETAILFVQLPVMQKVRGLVPGDEVHTWTVDRHSVEVVCNLARLLDDKSVAIDDAIRTGRENRLALMLAGLLHDVTKGCATKEGARRAIEGSLRRLGLGEKEISLVSFLCLNHMVLPEASVRKDFESQGVHRELAVLFQDIIRLDLSLILSTADMRSLSSGCQSLFREDLLRRMWAGARKCLVGDSRGLKELVKARREKIASFLPKTAEASRLSAVLSDRFLLAFEEQDLFEAVELLLQASRGETQVVVRSFEGHTSALRVLYAGKDMVGLLARLSSVLTLQGLSIEEARIFTIDLGLVLDEFRVVLAGGAFCDFEAMENTIKETMVSDRTGILSKRLLETTKKPWGLVAEVDNTASEDRTVIRVYGPDAPGIVYSVADLFFREGLDVSGAIITTQASRVYDTFFVSDAKTRQKVVSPSAIRKLIRGISRLPFVE